MNTSKLRRQTSAPVVPGTAASAPAKDGRMAAQDPSGPSSIVRRDETATKTRAIEQPPGETGGPKGPEPTRFGDWEKGGRCFDF